MPGWDRNGAVAGALSRAAAWLETRQLPSGAFPNYSWTEPDMDSRVADPSVFPTTLIAYCLSFVPASAPMRERALDFLEGEADRRGLWRHWSRENPRCAYAVPDLDDTSCAAIALMKGGRAPPDHRARILANRTRGGLFRTWVITPERLLRQPFATYRFFTRPASRPGDVDGVVNANVLLYLGDLPETRPVIDYLLGILRCNEETRCDKWYDDPFVVWYFFSRALAARSAEAGGMIVDRILSTAPAQPLDLALGACGLIDWGRSDAAGAWVARLLATQAASGGWPIAPFYKGGRVRWGSEELVTAFCLEALARWRAATAR